LKAVRAIVLHRLAYDVVEARIDRHALRGRLEVPARQRAREHVVHHHAERIDVRAMIDVRRPFILFRRRVIRSPHAEARLGHQRVLRIELLRQAEVRHLRAPVRREEDVRGFNIAVHDALLVRDLQRIADLRDELERHFRRAFARFDRIAQVAPLHELHANKQVVVPGVAAVIDAHDVGVRERGHGIRLALEALLEREVVRHVRAALREDLDGDRASQRHLQSLVNRAHAALAEKALHDVAAAEHRLQFLRQRQLRHVVPRSRA
jgi:hypothetical protein